LAADFFAVFSVPDVALFFVEAAAFLLAALLLPTTVSDPGPGVNVDSSPVDH
jgi:hypothetical protein